jgi:hypothetical protein
LVSRIFFRKPGRKALDTIMFLKFIKKMCSIKQQARKINGVVGAELHT